MKEGAFSLDLPPVFWIGLVLLPFLLIIRFLLAHLRDEEFNVGMVMRIIYTSFGTTTAVTSSVIASHFALFGVAYPGQSLTDLQLIMFVAAATIFTGGLYFFYRDIAEET